MLPPGAGAAYAQVPPGQQIVAQGICEIGGTNLNWKKLKGYPTLHQEVAATSLPDGGEVNTRQSITN